jgi:hypothetical protein
MFVVVYALQTYHRNLILTWRTPKLGDSDDQRD